MDEKKSEPLHKRFRLVSMQEICAHFGVGSARIAGWIKDSEFPKPDFELGNIKRWTLQTVITWQLNQQGKPPEPYIPPPVVIRSKSSQTYFIQADNGGPIKIGRASNIRKRLASLQCSHSRMLVLLASMEGDHEAEMHEKFAHLRIKGEWFRAEGELLDFLKSEFGCTVVEE